ncbi:GNAT superfamily N-acetyltransferase [Rhodococcus fascians]|uniref:GNAT family N-acetyltransferase n=1 Tax=Nocardiaceae TaxID=85025 RepID=UPI002859B96A|nr:GNAT superfamily N-acetyltransferase [Rhodococcus sp. 3258]MDR6934543.1 GNAT superfamily N-acetyltransferase [Rhodococcus fascians]
MYIDGMSTWSLDEDLNGVLVSVDRDESVLGVLVASAEQYARGNVLYVQHLVVVPEARGRGVGTVSLGMVEQLLPGTPLAMIWGQCEPSATGFYERAGFTVLAPGEPFPFLMSDSPSVIVNSNPTYNCWFYR